MAVSPFDGITRIRFKGSPDCRLLMLPADFHPHSHSEIRIQTGLSASRLPRKLCSLVYYTRVSPTTREVSFVANVVIKNDLVC